MLRFAALNESDSGEEECDQEDEPTTTKEAEEAEAFTMYNRALGLQRAGDGEEAEQLFSSLLQHPFLLKARMLIEAEQEDSHHPALPLLYLVHKNMAASAVAKGNFVDAMKSYLEAVKIDSSEVTVWYKMGTVAKRLHNYPLARLAYEQGLQCNERHWPSLDAVITMLYALNDYGVCLEYCGRALERDPYYTKGLVFTRQIMKEQPSLIADTKELFAYCDPIIHTVTVDPKDTEMMIKECVDIRDKRRELAKQPDPPPLKLPRPITQLTWKCIGECLVALFDDFTSSDPPKSLVLPLDMEEYIAMAEGKVDHPVHPTTSTPTSSPSAAVKSPSISTVVSSTTTTTTCNDTTALASLSDQGDLQKTKTDATAKTQSTPPAPTMSSTADPVGVSGAVTDPTQGEQGEQPMEVGEAGVQCQENDKEKINRTEVTVTSGLKPADQPVGDQSFSDISSVDLGKKEERNEEESRAKVNTQDGQVTSGKPADDSSGAELACQSPTAAKKDSNGAGNIANAAISSSVSVNHQPSAVVMQSSATAAAASTAVGPSIAHTTAITLSLGSTPATDGLTSEAGAGATETSQRPLEGPAPNNKVSNSVRSEAVTVVTTTSSGVENTVTTTPSTASVTGQSIAQTVTNVDSIQPTAEGKQEGTAAGLSSAVEVMGLSQQGNGVKGTEKKQEESICGHTPPTQPLRVDVELAAGTSPVVGSSSTPLLSSATGSVAIPVVTVSGETVSDTKPVDSGSKVTATLTVVPSSSYLSPRKSTASPVPAHKPVQSSPGKVGASVSPSQRPPASSPSLPKFQFNTITAMEVQALLQDCVPSTPLLSTPAPSSYSSSLVERFKQTAAVAAGLPSVSTASASPSSVATGTSSAAATLGVGEASAGTGEPSTAGDVMEATGEVDKTAEVAAGSQQDAAAPTPVSAKVALQDHVGMGRGAKGNRRGTKRKRAPVEKPPKVIGPEDYGIKRRSARVRNTRKEEENVDIQKLLHNFLPPSLTQPVQDEEESQVEDITSASQGAADGATSELCGGPPLEESEKEDVRNYLKECVKRQGVVGLMYKYLVHLSTRDNRVWPLGVTDLYLKVYERARDHLTFPSLYCMDFPEVCYTELSKMALVWSELALDSFVVKRADTIISPSQRQGGEPGPTETGPFADPNSEEDLLFITGMVESGMIELLEEQQTPFAIRAYWMKGRLAVAGNQMDKGLETLEWVADYLREENGVSRVYLPNCQMDKTISLEEVKRQQESLKRCQSLEESQRLFDTGQYQQVIDSLTSTCLLPHATHRTFKPALPERHAQLELLQDALYQQEEWGRCLLWGEVVLDEALHHYRRAPTVATRDSWALTLVHLLEGLQRVLDREMNAMQLLPLRSLVRLTQNLIRIIEVNHDVSEMVTEMPIASVLPWMLLHRIIRQEESKLESRKVREEEEEGSPSSPQAATSPSLMLLSVAHEYLGRNSWCTREFGIFLLFYMDILTTELPTAHHSIKDDLDTAFEQCVFCLYGHPNKKGRARHLVDHNTPCIELMWEHCEAVFDYFKPKTLPEFDSYKTSTVSGELHNLLRRIYALIPESDDISQRLNQMHNYIEGNTSTPPNFSSSCIILQEIYYLLGDYYFKNKEQTKAIKFYTYDVCCNSSRFDSWAGLALAKMYQLEQKLNSMELKIDSPVHKKSIAALRCFSRAVEIDESVRKLWIEYGSLAYQLHSHASRQLRMKLWFPLTPELLDIAMETRVEMLATARNCYWKASKCEAEGSEEEWLHHYMMGKVMEKQRAHPRLYLEHYKQAAIYLHEEEAKYPRKILYNFSPPHLALEALEMYYRLHVAVMKHLLRISSPETKDDMALFDRYLTEATESPFALRKEKHNDTQDVVSSADDSQCSVISLPPYSTAHQKPVYHMTPQDHNYSKQKSSGGETSDASCEVKETGTETDGSQSSEDTDAIMKDAGPPSSRAHTNTEGKKGGSQEVDEERRKADGGGQSSQVEMMELHAETDSQVSGHLPDTKPLFYDKQVSGGFIPELDKHLSLVGGSSSSQPASAVASTASTTTTTATTSAQNVAQAKQVPKQGPTDPPRNEKPIVAVDSVKREVAMEIDNRENETKQKDGEGDDRVMPAQPDSDQKATCVQPSTEVSQAAKRMEQDDAMKTSNNSMSSESSVILISSSDDPSQSGQDRPDLSRKSVPSAAIVVSPVEEQDSQSSPQKRSCASDCPEQSKRRKLSAEDSRGVSPADSVEDPEDGLMKVRGEKDQGQTISKPEERKSSREITAKSSMATKKDVAANDWKGEPMEIDGGKGDKAEAKHDPDLKLSPLGPESSPSQAADAQKGLRTMPHKIDLSESPASSQAAMMEGTEMPGLESPRVKTEAADDIKKESCEDIGVKEPGSSASGPHSGDDLTASQPALKVSAPSSKEQPGTEPGPSQPTVSTALGQQASAGTPPPPPTTVPPQHPACPSDQMRGASGELGDSSVHGQGKEDAPLGSSQRDPAASTSEVLTTVSGHAAWSVSPADQSSTDRQEEKSSLSSGQGVEERTTAATQPPQKSSSRKETEMAINPPEQKAPSPPGQKTPNPPEQKAPGSPELKTTGPVEKGASDSAEQKTSGPSEQKSSDPVGQKHPGPSEQKTPSLSEQKTPGPSEQKTPGPSEQKTPGPSEQKTPGPSEQKTPGPSEQKTSGPSDQKTSGPSDQKTSGPSDQKTPGPSDQKTSGTANPQAASAGGSGQQSSTGGAAGEQRSGSGGQAQPKLEGDSEPAPVVLDEEEFREWKKRLLDKCVDGLHICLSRFPTHYKSLYRLAYLYYASDKHRNLEFARDLLLGNTNWANLSYMPANGLFSDRKTNNFFNGMWKIPIDEIDRSGSFASHVNRSVQLLLEVLRDLGDVAALLQVQSQLKKKPLDPGRKYLRDGERHILAQMAHSYTLDAVAQQLCRPVAEVDNTDLVLSAFRAYNSHRYGGETQRAMMLLIAAYQRLGLPKHGYNTPLEQAMQYCNTLIASQALAQKAERARLLSQSSSSGSMFPVSSSHPTPPHTMDMGTGPMPLHTPPGRPLNQNPGLGLHSGPPAPLMGMRGQSAVPSSHHALHTPSAAVQATGHHPGHIVPSRTRTMSASRSDMPTTYDPSGGMSRQHPTTAALDLSPPSQKMSSAARQHVSSGQKVSTAVGQGVGVEVIDLTSPEKSAESMPMTSPGSRPRTSSAGWGQSVVGGAGGRSAPEQGGRLKVVAGGVQGSPGAGPPRPLPGPHSAGGLRPSFPHPTHLSIGQATPPRPRPSPSPFSSPHPCYPSSSAPSTPNTPRPHTSTADEASDLDLTSDQEDELALTSPDKLTSDIRHHFHGDLL